MIELTFKGEQIALTKDKDNKFGIDNVKKAIVWAIQTTNEVLGDLEDGKLKLLELIALANNATDFVQIAKNWQQLIDELKDLTPSEQIGISNLVAANIPNGQDVAKKVKWVLNVFDWICIGFALIADAK